MRCNKELEGEIKLRHYYEMINYNVEDQKHIIFLTNVKKKIHIIKIRFNSHELHRKTFHWSILKLPWDKRLYLFCDTMKIEDEKHIL